MLYIIATPIGNLKDITYRAVETLALCDYCLCEDTRQSQKLLNAYDLNTPLRSYHKFNEASLLSSTIEDLKQGKNIALISDAGTPLVSDPGALLVRALIENKLPYTHLPGPCASVYAFLASGFDAATYSFLGFAPKKEAALKTELITQLESTHAGIYYLSPRQILSTLDLLEKLCPDRALFLGKELTKKFETFFHGTAGEIKKFINTSQIKGEWVLAISPLPKDAFHDIEPLEYMAKLQSTYDIPKREAIKLCAQILKIPKREIYGKDLDSQL